MGLLSSIKNFFCDLFGIETKEEKEAKNKNEQKSLEPKDKQTATSDEEKEKEEGKLDILNTDLNNEIAERDQLENQRNRLIHTHSIYMCNDLFGAYSSSSTNHNLVAGFARRRDYDSCLFNPAIRLSRYDLFAHELGHNLGLGEISNDLSITIGNSKENFMDYEVVRRSFHYWQWETMYFNLINKQIRINKIDNTP